MPDVQVRIKPAARPNDEASFTQQLACLTAFRLSCWVHKADMPGYEFYELKPDDVDVDVIDFTGRSKKVVLVDVFGYDFEDRRWSMGDSIQDICAWIRDVLGLAPSQVSMTYHVVPDGYWGTDTRG